MTTQNEPGNATSRELTAMFPAEIIAAPATTPQEFDRQTGIISRRATDLCSCPTIQDGYEISGHHKATAIVNMSTMAEKRIKSHFPKYRREDPIMMRLCAQARYLVAECLKLKYECRAQRKEYDHLRDATVKIDRLVRVFYDKYRTEVKKIVNGVYDGV